MNRPFVIATKAGTTDTVVVNVEHVRTVEPIDADTCRITFDADGSTLDVTGDAETIVDGTRRAVQ